MGATLTEQGTPLAQRMGGQPKEYRDEREIIHQRLLELEEEQGYLQGMMSQIPRLVEVTSHRKPLSAISYNLGTIYAGAVKIIGSEVVLDKDGLLASKGLINAAFIKTSDGVVTLDVDGVTILHGETAPHKITWKDAPGNILGDIWVYDNGVAPTLFVTAHEVDETDVAMVELAALDHLGEYGARAMLQSDGYFNLVKGHFVIPDTYQLMFIDSTRAIWPVGNDLKFKDPNAGEKTLSELATGSVGGCHGSSYPINNQSISGGTTYTSGDLRDGIVVPSDAVGLWMILKGTPPATGYVELAIDSADDTPDAYSSMIKVNAAGNTLQGLVMTRLGTGANAGKVKIKALSGNWTMVYAWPVGYWK